MKNIFLCAVISICITTFTFHSFCEGKSQGSNRNKNAVSAKSQKGKRENIRRHQAFTGLIVHTDSAAKMISVKGRGRTVTFDVSNPFMKGYRSVEDLKSGDYVAVSYTFDGVRIVKITKSEALSDRGEISERPATAKKGVSRRARVKEKGSTFNDVDENKDGKISPVELSAVVKDLQMKQFKEYDKDGDGYLSESEFQYVVK
ncbi:MAG: hypothetical protein C0392_05435 [Syntrophus sp. (in: bacteria)]|nr:hypothetical protein [Syntrophus sp. (in: bacteria)]